MPPFFMPKDQSLKTKQYFEEAKEYQGRSGLVKGNPAAYQYLWRRGLLDQACSHMQISPVYVAPKWTQSAVLEIASKHRRRSEFRRANEGAYAYALTNGLLNRACAHMRDGHNFWHVFELMAVALKYDDKSTFIRSEQQAYTYACRYKLTKMVFAHMTSLRIDWDKAAVMAEAARHTSRGVFQAGAPGAYKHADKNAYLDEACAHMPPPIYGFSQEKAANLYQIRFMRSDGFVLYKVGITNREPAARLSGMRLNEKFSAEVIEVIRFESGREARIAEKRLHRQFARKRYVGEPIMHNGNTELFTVNLLDS